MSNHRITVFYAMKGGSGTTVTSALTALNDPADTLIVDLGGDMADALGQHVLAPTLDDWLLDVSLADTPIDDLIIRVNASTRLLPASRRIDLSAGSAEQRRSFHKWLEQQPTSVVIDAGTGLPHSDLVEQADQTLAVARPCYLGLIKAARTGFRPDGVIVIREAARALGTGDIERAFNAPVLVTVDDDPLIARLADAGLLSARSNRLGTRLRHLLHEQSAPSGLDAWRAADPARQSPDVDYGMRWSSEHDAERRWRVSWNTGSGDLYAVDATDGSVIELGHYNSGDEAAQAVHDWTHLHAQANGLDRLLSRFEHRTQLSDGPSIA